MALYKIFFVTPLTLHMRHLSCVSDGIGQYFLPQASSLATCNSTFGGLPYGLGISLLNTEYKIYTKIFAKRLTVTAEALLLEEQNGFRKDRSCMDCIFSASQIIGKHREFNFSTYIAFIDFKKAFESVDRDKLWTIMSSKGIQTHLITIIQKIYMENIIRVNAGNGIS